VTTRPTKGATGVRASWVGWGIDGQGYLGATVHSKGDVD